jgi:cytochrome c oxidase subunit 4
MQTPANESSHRLTYVLVFLILGGITAVEIGLTFLGLPRATARALFLTLSLAKAVMVALFYMHLKYDHRLYAYIFIVPVALLAIFAYLTVAS